ncbi:Uncharacterized protein C4orf45 homolog [Geodia barretti]|nr:Uncharacterized protein C4orf45 homolog [Geodia barretti]
MRRVIPAHALQTADRRDAFCRRTVKRDQGMSTVSSLEEGLTKPKGAVLFTGPDGVGNHRTTVADPRYVGHGFTSPESSSDTQYLYRSAPTCPHPAPKSARVGEVGWGVPKLTHSNDKVLKSGHQIQLKEFRQAVEDRHTHLYQNPYYPPPPPSSTVATETTSSRPRAVEGLEADSKKSVTETSAHSGSTGTVEKEQ